MPALRSHTLVFSTTETGTTITFQMSASNIIGSVFTSEFSFVLAAVPDQPQTVPVLNLEQTSSSQIHIDYPALATSENGGSPILSYELSVYDTDS